MHHAIIFSYLTHDFYNRNSGPHRLATHLRKLNWDIEVIDFANYWSLDELKEIVRSRVTSDTKFFGISQFSSNDYMMSLNGPAFFKWVKDTYPDIATIIGSQELAGESILYCDYVISGYAEKSIEALLSYLFSNGEKPVFKTRGTTKYIDSQKDYPAHPWQDTSVLYEKRDFVLPHEFGAIEMSRGCMFSCAFCNATILGVKDKTLRAIESVKDEMLFNYNEYGMANYFVTDPTFNTSTEKISVYADLMEQLPWKPYFIGYIRPDLLVRREADRQELLRMNFLGHFYGVETFHPEAARFIQKGNPDMVQQGLIEVKKYFKERVGNDYRAIISLIVGLPYEDMQSIQATYDWIYKNWRDQPVLASSLALQDFSNPSRSYISRECEQLGYNTINKTIEDMKTVEERDAFEEVAQMNDTYGVIQWESQHMDIFEAEIMANKFKNINLSKHGINYMKVQPEQLNRMFCDDQGNPLPLEKRLLLLETQSEECIDNFKNVYISKYKEKKLSL
jgi:hypothetical protein